MAFTPEQKIQIAEYSAAIKAALDKVGKEFGFTVSAPSLRLDPSDLKNMTITIQTGNIDTSPKGVNPAYVNDLRRIGHNYGLTVDMIGTIFPTDSGPAEFLGFSKSKLAFKRDGKPYVARVITNSVYAQRIITAFKG